MPAAGVLAVQADMSTGAGVRKLFEACDAEFGAPDALVNNAGTTGPIRKVADIDADTLRAVFELKGIRVNAVRPGLIDTELHAAAGAPDRLTRLMSGVPMGRAGSAVEGAETILWLAGPQSSYMSGALVDVSGAR